MIKQLLLANTLSLIWSGNNGFLIRGENKLIAFDLDLFNHQRISPCTLDLKLLCENLDLLMVTHAHEDHMSTQTIELLIKESNCHFMIPASCNSSWIPAERLTVVEPHHTYSTHRINIETTRAVHGHINGSVYSGANMLDCGYIVTLSGKRIYQPGDTILLEEHADISGIDLLFLSTTEHNTWINNSIRLIEQIKPKLVIPQHHSTYLETLDNLFWTHGYVQEVHDLLSDKSLYQIVPQEQLITLNTL